eukprot:TRINITY_DN9554_c0_g1_i1.p1 TRINITY_DN9554_c0_g1~~TRINITY_DN9554_c0_g1_i1.p1  ORF type:complete len:157 (+),score=25.47 TRINITY_DN9554_c0_g1_i1:54-524(+)
MRHKKALKKFSRSNGHRKAFLRNLVTQIIKHDKIKTTITRAKVLSRLADKMVTMSNRKPVLARRAASWWISDRPVLEKLLRSFPQRFATIHPPYTRIIPLGYRKGDCSHMAYVGFVDVLPSLKQLEAVAKINAPDVPYDRVLPAPTPSIQPNPIVD